MTQFTNPYAGLLGGLDMKGILNGILSGDSELAQKHQQTKARALPSPGSAAYGALSPEAQEAVDRERERRRQAGERQRREYLDSVGGYGNYEGGFNDADYWNAGWATMDGTYYYDGQVYDGTPGNDPTNGSSYTGGGLGAGYEQNPNRPDDSGGVEGGGSGGSDSGGSGSGGSGSGGSGSGGGNTGGGAGVDIAAENFGTRGSGFGGAYRNRRGMLRPDDTPPYITDQY